MIRGANRRTGFRPDRLLAAVSIAAAPLLLSLLAGCTARPSSHPVSAASAAAAATTPPAPRAVELLREQSLRSFYAGKNYALSGQYDCARAAFAESMRLLASGSVPEAERPELWEFADELGASVDSYERFAVLEGGDDAPLEEEGTRLETLAEVSTDETTREEIDRSLSAVEGEDLTSFEVAVPLNDQVLAFISQYQGPLRGFFTSALFRSGRYLDLIEGIFEEEGLPKELAYMALVESAFKVNAHSPARAHGIWQFIPSTGRLYGLRSDGWVDERSDFEKSTRAAARYLEYLHVLFGDWHLAMAAYNAGEGKVLRSIRRSGRTDFWSLAQTRHLMRETRNYVPAILAAMIIGQDPERFGIPNERDRPISFDRVELESAVDLEVAGGILGVSAEEMKDLNPELRTRWTPPGQANYRLRVPTGTASLLVARLAELTPAERMNARVHVVSARESQTSVAKKYGIPVAILRTANSLGPKQRLSPGSTLLIPPRGLKPADTTRTASAGRSATTVKVRRGDTASSIAKRHGVPVSSLLAANGLSSRSVLRVGQKIRIPATGASAGRRGGGGETRVASSSRGHGSKGKGASSREAIRYSVRKGDTLSSIASAYGTTVDDLRKWNGLGRKGHLLPGQTLRLYSSGR